MTTQALLQLSADIITRYYNNEIEPFLAACHPDVLWIGPANTQIIRTRETLIETFAEEHHNLRFEMHDLVTVPLMTPSSKVLEVLLFYDVDTIWPDNSMQRVKQRVQLSWVVEGGQPFIRVCHVSNALDYDDRDVIYPVHYGEDRVRVAVLSGEDRAPRIVLKGANKAMLYLRPAYIDYLETSGMHTYIHTQNDIRESTERLTAIDYLNGEPGVYSARYAEPGKRKATVLEKLKGVPEEKRGAHFTSAICCVFPNGDVLEAEGYCYGRIAEECRGESGFGYDPIFICTEEGCAGKTFGEATAEEKDAVSHRGKSLRIFAEKLENYLKDKEG